MMVFRLMDTEIVINEVKARECLWNPKNPLYKNKTDKYKAWEEVSKAVLPKYASCSQDDRERIVRAVQSRWKTARDAYMKCRLTEVKKPTYRSRQHRYIYQENLKFLEQVKDMDESKVRDEDETSNSLTGDTSARQSTVTIDDDGDDGSDEVMDFDIDVHDDFKEKIENVAAAADDVSDKVINDDSQDNIITAETSSQNNEEKDPLCTADLIQQSRKRPHSARPRKIKSKMTEFETRLLKILRLKNSACANSSALHADDQFFFNSLAPLINNFDSHQKLTFRSKLLEVVMEVGNIGPVGVGIKEEVETYVFEDVHAPKI